MSNNFTFLSEYFKQAREINIIKNTDTVAERTEESPAAEHKTHRQAHRQSSCRLLSSLTGFPRQYRDRNRALMLNLASSLFSMAFTGSSGVLETQETWNTEHPL